MLAADAPTHWTAEGLRAVKHGFFGRAGGMSEGIYASLNAGTGSNDKREHTNENRRRIAAAFGAPPTHLMGVHQVHSPDSVFVDAPWSAERPRADALVTKTPGLVLSVLAADCTPVLLADADAGIVAAAHAGWKGAFGGVLESTVRLMVTHGARPERIAAAIGPAIQQASYEVGPEFEARLVDADANNARFFASGREDRAHFDLPGFCASRLAALGVGRIEALPLDTYTNADTLFSYRRSVHAKESDYGRNCSAISL